MDLVRKKSVQFYSKNKQVSHTHTHRGKETEKERKRKTKTDRDREIKVTTEKKKNMKILITNFVLENGFQFLSNLDRNWYLRFNEQQFFYFKKNVASRLNA